MLMPSLNADAMMLMAALPDANALPDADAIPDRAADACNSQLNDVYKHSDSMFIAYFTSYILERVR